MGAQFQQAEESMGRLLRAPCSDNACFVVGWIPMSASCVVLDPLEGCPKLLETSTQAILGFAATVQKDFGTN